VFWAETDRIVDKKGVLQVVAFEEVEGLLRIYNVISRSR
jgi:hypothetical protein